MDSTTASASVPAPVGALPATGSRREERLPHRVVLVVLLVFHALYYAYRYPLQCSDARTSATYADTPLFLRAADDVVFVLLLFLVVILKMTHGGLRLNRRHLLLAGAILLCFSGILFGTPVQGVIHVKGVILYSSLLAVLSAGDVEALLSFVLRRLVPFFLLLMAVDAVQVLLFVFLGRPPALAWSTNRASILTQDVRFGSIWDDPNSFGLFLALFVAWLLLSRLSLARKGILLALALAGAAASWSRTCLVLLGATVVGYLLATAWTALRRGRRFGATLRAALLGAVVSGAAIVLPWALEWAETQESSRIHLDAVLFRRVDASAFRLTAWELAPFESVFAFLAHNGGWAPALALFLILALPLLHLLRFNVLPDRDRTIAAWGALFLLSFFSIPFLWLAPLGLLYFLVLAYLVDRLGGVGAAT